MWSVTAKLITRLKIALHPPIGTYLEFLERTSNSITMRRCDDCNSDAIDLSANPVPFGEYHHLVARESMKLQLKLTCSRSVVLGPV